jgi:hypothetical protein
VGKVSGSTSTPVKPADPGKPAPPDTADPGEMSQIKAEQSEKGEGRYGAPPEPPPHKPPENEEEKEEKKGWIEIELVGEDDKPVPGVSYQIILPDGSKASGTLDEKGFARIEGFESGACKVSFPDLDKEAWEKS